MKTVVISPHPDDEVLGVGGTLLRRASEGADLAWVIVTAMTGEGDWPEAAVARRAQEIAEIAEIFGFSQVFELGFPTAALDRVPIGDIVGGISRAFKAFQPTEVFVPNRSDVHTDHHVVFDAVASCCKWFRYPSVRRVLAYETLSETDFGIGPEAGFRPTVFVDIAPFIDAKLDAMRVYQSELGTFPFPRSSDAIRALAQVRGAASGFAAAEAFELLRERG